MRGQGATGQRDGEVVPRGRSRQGGGLSRDARDHPARRLAGGQPRGSRRQRTVPMRGQQWDWRATERIRLLER